MGKSNVCFGFVIYNIAIPLSRSSATPTLTRVLAIGVDHKDLVNRGLKHRHQGRNLTAVWNKRNFVVRLESPCRNNGGLTPDQDINVEWDNSNKRKTIRRHLRLLTEKEHDASRVAIQVFKKDTTEEHYITRPGRRELYAWRARTIYDFLEDKIVGKYYKCGLDQTRIHIWSRLWWDQPTSTKHHREKGKDKSVLASSMSTRHSNRTMQFDGQKLSHRTTK